jgi:hypothetical protein
MAFIGVLQIQFHGKQTFVLVVLKFPGFQLEQTKVAGMNTEGCERTGSKPKVNHRPVRRCGVEVVPQKGVHNFLPMDYHKV